MRAYMERTILKSGAQTARNLIDAHLDSTAVIIKNGSKEISLISLMKKSGKFLTIFAVVAISGYAEAISNKTYNRLNRHSVMIMDSIKGGIGSGVLLDKNTVLTNHHVCDGLDNPMVSTKEGKRKVIKVIMRPSMKIDLCLMKLNKPVRVLKLPIAPKKTRIIGDRVYFIGYPLLERTLGMMVMRTRIKIKDDKYDMVIDIGEFPAVPGLSGSPVLNDKGQLVGVVFAMTMLAQHSYSPAGTGIVSLQEVRKFLRAVRY